MIPEVTLGFHLESDILAQKIEQALQSTDKAHDFAHIRRVRFLAQKLGQSENVDLSLVDKLALLHEVGDRKVLPNAQVSDFLPDPEGRLARMVKSVSWSSRHLFDSLPPEDQKIVAVVSDADKLEAMGAIGIARCLLYSGAYSRPVLSDILPRIGCTNEEYKSRSGESATNHFFEKLLILDLAIRTPLGKDMAKIRKLRMINWLIELAEETGHKYPRDVQSLLHMTPEVVYFGSGTLFTLNWTPESTENFIQVLAEKYQTIAAINSSENTFVISGVFSENQVYELVWKYLPNPRVVKVLE